MKDTRKNALPSNDKHGMTAHSDNVVWIDTEIVDPKVELLRVDSTSDVWEWGRKKIVEFLRLENIKKLIEYVKRNFEFFPVYMDTDSITILKPRGIRGWLNMFKLKRVVKKLGKRWGYDINILS